MIDAALAVSPPRLLLPPGTVLEEKYRLERFLGQGEMGCVFLATHLTSGDNLALKLLHPVDPSRGPEAFAGFLIAARAAARFRSDHVAHVLDMGMMEDGSPYLVMEYLEGETLETHLRALPLPLPVARAVDIVLQAAKGLGDAHAAGVVHRNARPSKWFLTRTPNSAMSVKLLDFGGSKITPRLGRGEDTRLSGVGPVGAPPYAAPEQIRAPAEADARSDVWTMGVVLHELLASAPPFRGETIRAARSRALAAAPYALRARRSDMAPELEAVVMRCLEKNPAERIASIAELILALAPFHGAWERSSVTPTPAPVAATIRSSTPAPAPAVAEPVLPPLPAATTLALARAADKTPEAKTPEAKTPEAAAQESVLMASVSSVTARPEQHTAIGAALEQARALGMWVRSLPRVAIVAAVGVLGAAAGVVFVISPDSAEPTSVIAQPNLAWAAASAPSRPAASATPALAAAADVPAPRAPLALPSDNAVDPIPPAPASTAGTAAPAEPAPRARASKPAARSPASKPLASGATPPVGTAGFGDRE
jgi:serine/threonine protein kinase